MWSVLYTEAVESMSSAVFVWFKCELRCERL